MFAEATTHQRNCVYAGRHRGVTRARNRRGEVREEHADARGETHSGRYSRGPVESVGSAEGDRPLVPGARGAAKRRDRLARIRDTYRRTLDSARIRRGRGTATEDATTIRRHLQRLQLASRRRIFSAHVSSSSLDIVSGPCTFISSHLVCIAPISPCFRVM